MPREGNTERPRQRARLACVACNKRKSRCDASEVGCPCSDCKRLGRHCEMLQSRRGKHPRVKRNTGSSESVPLSSLTTDNEPNNNIQIDPSQAQSSTSLFDPSLTAHSDATTSREALHLSPGLLSLSDTQSNAIFQLGPNSVPSSNPIHSNPIHSNPIHSNPVHSSLGNASSLIGSSVSGENLLHSHSFPTRSISGLSETQNSTGERFSETSLHPDTDRTPRSAQGGSGDHQVIEGAEILVDLLSQATRLPNAVHDSRQVTYLPESSTHGHLLSHFLNHKRVHYSAPVQSPNHAAATATTSSGTSRSPMPTPLQLEFLQRSGCFDHLASDTTFLLLTSYFKYAHGSNQIIDEVSFGEQYRNESIPLILFWAVMFVGAMHCEESQLISAGFTSRKLAMRIFYERAKTLIDAEYGEDRVATVQAMLLLGQNWNQPTDIRADAYYWVGLAISLAQVLGMHRCTGTSKMDNNDRKLWRKVWWSCVLRDRWTAGGIGRPYRIHLDFCDVELPTLDDFDISDTTLRNLPFKIANSTTDRQDQALYFIESTKLCVIATDVIRIENVWHTKPAERGSMKDRQEACFKLLRDWKAFLSPSMRLVENGRSTIWALYLHLAYHVWIILLFRGNAHDEESRRMPSKSACLITHIFEEILERGSVAGLPGHGVTSVFAAITQHAIDRKLSQNKLHKQLAHNRLKLCILTARTIARVRPTAGWFLNIFFYLEKLQAREQFQQQQELVSSEMDAALTAERLRPSDHSNIDSKESNINNMNNEIQLAGTSEDSRRLPNGDIMDWININNQLNISTTMTDFDLSSLIIERGLMEFPDSSNFHFPAGLGLDNFMLPPRNDNRDNRDFTSFLGS